MLETFFCIYIISVFVSALCMLLLGLTRRYYIILWICVVPILHWFVIMEWDAKETPRDILDFYVRNGYALASDEVVLFKKLMGG